MFPLPYALPERSPDGHFGFMDEYGVTGSSFPVTSCPFPVTPLGLPVSPLKNGQDAHSTLTVIVFSPLKVNATVPSAEMTAFCTSMFQS